MKQVLKFAVFLIILNIFVFVLLDQLQLYQHQQELQEYKQDPDYVVKTPGCKIPYFDGFDPRIREKVQQGKYVNCNKYSTLTKSNSTSIRVDWSVIRNSEFKDTFSHCKYHVVYRPRTDKGHSYYTFVNESSHFNDSVNINDDFIRVQCFNKNNKKIYTNYYWFYKRNDTLEEICDIRFKKHNQNPNQQEYMNILLLGVDSTSRLNFQRFFIKTKYILSTYLPSYEFYGYHIVGEDTYHNLVSLTTGKTSKELLGNESERKTFFDGFNFIWNNFSNAGYRTILAEDSAYGSTFDYLKRGFRNFPTDYFYRPLSSAIYGDKSLWKNKYCINDVTEVEFVLNYMTEFLIINKDRPYFAFTFLTRLTHDKLERAAQTDEYLDKFFRSLLQKNALHNTVLILFGDHGMRYGAVRNTEPIGGYELRMPVLHFAFPKWFSIKYKKIMTNVKQNTAKLVTAFDIFETLNDILYFKEKDREEPTDTRRRSILRKMPDDRNCSTAGISLQFCSCHSFKQVDKTLFLYYQQIFSKMILKYINNLLSPKANVCAKLRLDTTIGIYQVESLHEMQIFKISIRTIPGGGVFEALIYFNSDLERYEIEGVNRMNMYNNQSHCVNVKALKYFCFCKDLIDRYLHNTTPNS